MPMARSVPRRNASTTQQRISHFTSTASTEEIHKQKYNDTSASYVNIKIYIILALKKLSLTKQIVFRDALHPSLRFSATIPTK